MNVIFDRNIAQELKSRYLILELEPIEYQGNLVECFCLVSNESIPISEIPSLEHFSKLHDLLIENFRKKNFQFCRDIIEHLRGKFGGELDSFYQYVLGESSSQG